MADKYKKFFAILKEKGINEEQRKELILSWTDGRTDSLNALTNTENNQLLFALKQQKGRPDPADIMRKKVIFLLASMQNYETSDGRLYNFINAGGKIQMHENGIYDFVRRVGFGKKHFNSYTLQELPKLVTQIEQLRKNTWGSEANKAVNALKSEVL